MTVSVRGKARTREGVVVSNAMDKTAVVVVRRRVQDRRYRKFVSISKKYVVHDESNACEVGDTVVIAESRPLSKRKRWRLRDVLKRSVKEVAATD